MYLKGLYLFFHSFQFFICILLSKMTKQMLKGIRVNSKEELSERIYRYFDEINADPIVYHWTYKMDEIDPDGLLHQKQTLANGGEYCDYFIIGNKE